MKIGYDNLSNLICSFSLVYDMLYENDKNKDVALKDVCKKILFDQTYFNLRSIDYIARMCNLKLNTKFYSDQVVVKTYNKQITGRILLVSDSYIIMDINDEWVIIDFKDIKLVIIDKYSNL